MLRGYKFSQAFRPLSVFCSPAEKIPVIYPPDFVTKTRENNATLIIFSWKHFLFLYNVSHFDKKCRESHLSLSLDRFVQAHPLTTVIDNQINIILSMLQWII